MKHFYTIAQYVGQRNTPDSTAEDQTKKKPTVISGSYKTEQEWRAVCLHFPW